MQKPTELWTPGVKLSDREKAYAWELFLKLWEGAARARGDVVHLGFIPGWDTEKNYKRCAREAQTLFRLESGDQQ